MNRPWLPRSLRARLTLWHVAAMVLVLVVYAAAVFTLVRRNVSQALDDRLRSDFRWAAEMAEQRPDGTLTWFDGDARHENSPWLQVWSEDGQALFRTAVATRLPVPASDRLARDPDGRIVSVPTDTVPFRVLSGHATIAGRPVVLQVGASEAAMRQELRELLLVLLLGLPLSVVAAGLGGYWLARGALAPMNRMAERARAITAERLGERLPGRQSRRRARAAGGGVQRHPQSARIVVRADAAVHVGRLARAEDPADRHSERRGDRVAGAAR